VLILGIDTATSRSSVALVSDTTVLVAAFSDRPRRHGEFIAPAVKYCLNEAGVGFSDLDAIACDVGPGLYTGMRVGIGLAQTLAAATGVKTAAVTSTEALAYAVRHLNGRVLVSMDGRRGEVFIASYDVDGAGVHQVLEPTVLSRAEALPYLAEAPVAVVGDGFDTATLDAAKIAPTARFGVLPHAADVACLARSQVLAGTLCTPDQLQPVYLRHADAKIGWETHGKLGGDSTP
jgi:tRNA threonylcarbamoyladenosine biosynthesis protein TsaB